MSAVRNIRRMGSQALSVGQTLRQMAAWGLTEAMIAAKEALNIHRAQQAVDQLVEESLDLAA